MKRSVTVGMLSLLATTASVLASGNVTAYCSELTADTMNDESDIVAGENTEDFDSEAEVTQDFAHDVTSLSEFDLGVVNDYKSAYRSPYITSVKNQEPYGNCWAFSAIAAIESSLWKEGLANSNVDLSEWQLTYFNYNSSVDPLGLTDGDMVITTDYLKQGGNQYMATATLANWKGVVSEGLAPYSTVKTNPNAGLSSSLAYDNDLFHLENAYWIARADINEVKQAILNYGSVVCNYYQNSYFFNSETNAYYCPSPYTYNHGIVIVGWDDNFDHSKFGASKPGMNGAWLCKNSWGSGWGDDGYFWISYGDGSLDHNVYAYDMTTANNYMYNYQYDGTPAMLNGTESTSTVYTANVYTAVDKQMLEAVGYYTYDTLYKTTVMVYKNPGSLSNPASGTLVSSQTVTDTYAGFHTLVLDNPVLLSKGDVFSIVVKQTSSDGKEVHYYVDHEYNSAGLQMISYAEEGQSFVSTNGTTWDDIGAADQVNHRIKAYANPTSVEAEEWNTMQFITRLYETCLNRSPDESGMEYWMEALLTGERSGSDVATGFVFSREYLNRNASDREYITMLYHVFLNRLPDESGFTYWLATLKLGLSREYVLRGFAQSTEFAGLCDAYGIYQGEIQLSQARDLNPNVTLYVGRMYEQALGREGEAEGLNYWCNVIVQGTRTPEEVAEAFFHSDEFQNKNLSNADYVKTLYRTFLGREYDATGYYHWIGELKRGVTRDEVLHQFAGSEEFAEIMRSFGL